jgi:phosphonate transport system substrate-binding protein
MTHVARRVAPGVLLVLALAAACLTACGSSATGSGFGDGAAQTLRIGAIPDQDPQQLQRLYSVVASHLSDALGVPVEYRPVTDYAASVTAFKTRDLDLVWFGGLTAAQARYQVPGARALAQRDVDTDFHSVFIANTESGLRPFQDEHGLRTLRGQTFTFGSESSTSGRLMPQYFLDRAGLTLADFKGSPGFSGSHDATIAVVEAGAYDAGVVNEQVWKDRLDEGTFDATKVRVLWRTPGYRDYRWIAQPDLDERFGGGFTRNLTDALIGISRDGAREEQILDLFGAGAFVPVHPGDDREIVEIARKLLLLGKAGA